MLISPHEQERLLIHVAAGLARERRARGLRLNYPEAVAMITSFLLARATTMPGPNPVERGHVHVHGEVIEEAPATELPMAQRYILF